jgi:hypothetical protein
MTEMTQNEAQGVAAHGHSREQRVDVAQCAQASLGIRACSTLWKLDKHARGDVWAKLRFYLLLNVARHGKRASESLDHQQVSSLHVGAFV